MTSQPRVKRADGPSRTGALALTLVACLGCDRGETEVRSYTVPKEGPPANVVPPPPVVSGEMLWDLPDGWARVANTSPMRFATLIAGEGDHRIEISVTQLSGRGGGIAANINRWRGQLGLPPGSAEELSSQAELVDARGARGLLVDLIGPPGDGSDAPQPRMLAAVFPSETDTWFIKTMATRSVLDEHRAAFVELCESVRFSGSQAPTTATPAGSQAPTTATPAGSQAPPAPAAPTWGSLPEGWAVDAQPKPMSVVSFTVSDGSQEASLTVTPLGGAQDLLANINRWRRQVGLGPIADLGEDPPVPLEVAGQAGSLVDIAGADRRTLGVVSTQGAVTWYFKLSGPDPLVSSQRDAFETFIRSIRFDGGSDE